jgi:hypothetical protein
LIVLEIRKRTHQTKTRRLQPDETALDFKFFEKTSFASIAPGNPRSGKVHDWYALVEGHGGLERPRLGLIALPYSSATPSPDETGCASSSQCQFKSEFRSARLG